MPTDQAASTVLMPGRGPGKMVDLMVPADLDLASCDEGEYRSSSIGDVSRSHEGAGQRDRVSIIDIYGIAGGVSGPGGIIIDAATFPNTSPTVMAEVDAILDGIHLGYWG